MPANPGAPVPLIVWSAGVGEDADNRVTAVDDGEHERRQVELGGVIEVGAPRDEQTDHRGVPVP